MNLPTEKHIEKLVLRRSELTAEEQQWIQKWIRKDRGVRLLAEWFKTFHRSADDIESLQERPDDFSPVIELQTSQKKSIYSSGVFVLAAQTPVAGRNKKSLTTIRTFVSEEHKTLIRILHNSLKDQSKLHVISEFVRDDDIVLIEIRDKKNTMLVSEPGGTFVISYRECSQEAIKNWESCELHLPISKIRAYKNSEHDTLNFDTSEAYFEREELGLERVEDELHITFNTSSEEAPDKMVIYSEEKSTIWPVEHGNCAIDIQDLSDTVTTLYFYK